VATIEAWTVFLALPESNAKNRPRHSLSYSDEISVPGLPSDCAFWLIQTLVTRIVFCNHFQG